MGSVQIANELAKSSGAEPWVRQIAAGIVAQCKNVPREAPHRIAEWVRDNVQYTQESYGHEIIQGPATTLRTGTGDCDDLATTWASLCRSVGVPAYVAGIREAGDEGFFHAVGYSPGAGLVELSKDETYGGVPRGAHMSGVPGGTQAVIFSPETKQFHDVSTGSAPARPSSFRARTWLIRAAAVGLTLWFLR